MTQTTQYAPVLAKIGSERSKLLGENKIKTLIESKNLTEFAAQLRKHISEPNFQVASAAFKPQT